MEQIDLYSVLTDTENKKHMGFRIHRYRVSHSFLAIYVWSRDINPVYGRNPEEPFILFHSVAYIEGETSWSATHMTQIVGEEKRARLNKIGALSDVTRSLKEFESGQRMPDANMESILRSTLDKWQIWHFWNNGEVVFRVIGKNMDVRMVEPGSFS